MPGLGMDRHTSRRKRDRRGRGRAAGTSQDLEHAVNRVKSAMRNSPTQILRAEDTRALDGPARTELREAGYVPERSRFLRVPVDAARRALSTLRDLWGGAGLD